LTTIANIFGFDSLPPGNILQTRKFVCGCEYEIENILSTNNINTTGISIDIDNSLRNNGREFKTGPAYYEDTLKLFDVLHKGIKLGPDAFTDRTSIHVHVNMLQLTPYEARQFVLLYALLEPVFFEYVGPVRQGSIFCVPLSYTHLPSVYKNDIQGMYQSWQKYTAFNLVPLGGGKEGSAALGTIEFRHMYGTGDREKFTTCLTAIKELYEFIERTTNYSIINDIENGTSPQEFLHKAIPTFAKLYGHKANELCKNTMLDVKLSTGGLTK
jgi:hypothetical protein